MFIPSSKGELMMQDGRVGYLKSYQCRVILTFCEFAITMIDFGSMMRVAFETEEWKMKDEADVHTYTYTLYLHGIHNIV